MSPLLRNSSLNIGIKLIVAVLLIWVLHQQFFARDHIGEMWSVFLLKIEEGSTKYLLAAIILMPINWLFETLKWRVLILKFERHSLWQSYKAILIGVTFSIFTPNRIGEYGGRLLLVSREHNWKAVIATLVGSFSQLVALLSLGFLGLMYFIGFFMLETYMLRGIIVVGITMIALMLFCFYNIDLIIYVVKRIPYIHKFQSFIDNLSVLKTYDKRTLSFALLYAFARYTTYVLQYFFLLQFFGVIVPMSAAFAGIATIFLVQTSIPLPPLWDLIARGEVALQLWGLFDANEISILAATFGLWIINLIVPALIGMILMTRIDVVKSF